MGSETKGGVWIYTAVIRPMLTYGLVEKNTFCHLKKKVWLHPADYSGMKSCMSTTPTETMETLLGPQPLQLVVE
jgi:hypothetical protein